jgi:hypothetical protein
MKKNVQLVVIHLLIIAKLVLIFAFLRQGLPEFIYAGF